MCKHSDTKWDNKHSWSNVSVAPVVPHWLCHNVCVYVWGGGEGSVSERGTAIRSVIFDMPIVKFDPHWVRLGPMHACCGVRSKGINVCVCVCGGGGGESVCGRDTGRQSDISCPHNDLYIHHLRFISHFPSIAFGHARAKFRLFWRPLQMQGCGRGTVERLISAEIADQRLESPADDVTGPPDDVNPWRESRWMNYLVRLTYIT